MEITADEERILRLVIELNAIKPELIFQECLDTIQDGLDYIRED